LSNIDIGVARELEALSENLGNVADETTMVTYHIEPRGMCCTLDPELDYVLMAMRDVYGRYEGRKTPDGRRIVVIKTTTITKREVIDPTEEEIDAAFERFAAANAKAMAKVD